MGRHTAKEKIKNQSIEIECKVKLSLWSAIKIRIAGVGSIPKPEFPSLEHVMNVAILKTEGYVFNNELHYADVVYSLLKEWYENN